MLFRITFAIILLYFNFNRLTCNTIWFDINTSFKKTIKGFISENDLKNQVVITVYKAGKNLDRNEVEF